MRVPGWEERLFAHVEAARERPFKWGEHDCGLFADGATGAVTGVRVFRDLWSVRGYATERGAFRALRRAGFDRVAEALDARLPRRSRRLGRRGDLAAMGDPSAPMPPLGVITGAEVACLGPEGLVLAPLAGAHCVWGVD